MTADVGCDRQCTRSHDLPSGNGTIFQEHLQGLPKMQGHSQICPGRILFDFDAPPRELADEKIDISASRSVSYSITMHNFNVPSAQVVKIAFGPILSGI